MRRQHQRMMMSSAYRAALLLAAAFTAAAADKGEIDYSVLGINDLSQLEYSFQFEIDNDNNEFTLQYTFKHDRTLPVGDAETCVPGEVATEYDGLDYLEGRWFWERMPYAVQQATGVDHVSIDWNPCGHPPSGFLTPHYDIHPYRVTPEYRATSMHCVLLAGTPVCDNLFQEDESGRGYFIVGRNIQTQQLSNMPDGFETLIPDAVVYMGLHAANAARLPALVESWVDPVLMMVTHNSIILAVEPMIPQAFVEGSQDKSYEEPIEYVDQSIPTLPYQYSVDFDAAAGFCTVTFRGISALSRSEFETLVQSGATGPVEQQPAAPAPPKNKKNVQSSAGFGEVILEETSSASQATSRLLASAAFVLLVLAPLL